MHTNFLRRYLPSLSALRVFEVAARHLSFKSAADELSVTPTAISHQIRALEVELDCVLFIRQTRAVILSPEGEQLYGSIHTGFNIMADGIAHLKSRKQTTVTLSTTPAFATHWLVPKIASFQAQYPHINLCIHTSKDLVDLQSGAVDLAIRYGNNQDIGLISTVLLQDYLAPVASPSLNIQTVDDLLTAPFIHFDWYNPTSFVLTWKNWAHAAHYHQLKNLSGIHYSDESHAIQAAVAGQGIALLSLTLIKREIDMGLLVANIQPVLKGMTYYIARSADRPLSDAIMAVESWLLAQVDS